ncbi:hypothetical protein FJZ19_02880 [Candidatus Pacearchaeota archaeon]|nr:hypothetical protein [Candidatus Pacearchaeota archaeon]
MKVLFKKPILTIPILFSWFIFAGVVLFIEYWLNQRFEQISYGVYILAFFLLLFLVTMVICMCNIVMLEIVQQIESGQKTKFSKALKKSFVHILTIIPLAILWAVIWLIILILKSFTEEKNKSDKEKQISMENAAKTLAGADNPFLWWRVGLNMLEKALRMWIFLALPAIAWEDKGSFEALGRSTKIIRKHPVQFLTAYTLTEATALVMALPLIPIFMADEWGYVFSTAVWTGVIIYECIIWTLGIYLEQMSVGLLYLWYMKWEKKGSKGNLSSVKKPDLLDSFYEMKK